MNVAKTGIPRGQAAPTRLESIAEGARRVGVHPRTVRRWIADGRLTGYRVGPHLIRVDADEVDALLRPIPAAGAGSSA